jgi:hypothetical protein
MGHITIGRNKHGLHFKHCNPIFLIIAIIIAHLFSCKLQYTLQLLNEIPKKKELYYYSHNCNSYFKYSCLLLQSTILVGNCNHNYLFIQVKIAIIGYIFHPQRNHWGTTQRRHEFGYDAAPSFVFFTNPIITLENPYIAFTIAI